MRDKVVLRCVGTGDAFGSGGRLNSCYHLSVGGEQILLDCGCSSLIGLQKYQLSAAAIDTIIVSHLHGDHFGGIPFLLLEAKYVSLREKPLTLIGPPGLQQQVDTALEALYPGTIGDGLVVPLIYRELDPSQPLQQGLFTIQCCKVKHGSSPNAYALRVEAGGKSICYTGDTEWTENLIPLADGSDLLLAECFSYQQQVPSHLDYKTLRQQQKSLNSKKLVLTHLGPEILQHLPELELPIVSDGDLIEL
ncbi:MBL fold metallo-hydrolase [Malonomonas rubra]|uniref:MBL fold metallo-hydrolase n=1 Tax=Malonomonas rubra TaxID=57040 RepID=UPI0026EC8C44|nr:MBL fold metallo-hydrolase [Malonomonas rubra]